MKKKLGNPKSKFWTQKEVSRLKRLYPMGHNSELAEMFGRTTQSILKKARRLGVKKDWDGGYRSPQQSRNIWIKAEIKELRRMYLNSSNGDIAAKLNRSQQAVQTKIKKLRLLREFKEQGLIRKIKGGVNKWTDGEINILKELYLQKSREYIAKKLGRTPNSVAMMASRSGLFTATPRKKSWTAEDDMFLKKHIARWPIKKIAKKLGRTQTAAQRRAWNQHFSRNCPNQRRTQQRFWTEQEIKQLEYMFGRYSEKDIAAKFGRSLQSVIAKSKRLGLKNPSAWTAKNIAILKKFFPFETSVEVAKRLGKKPASIRFKAIELGLKKSIYAGHKRKY